MHFCLHVHSVDTRKHPRILQHGWIMYVAMALKADWLHAVTMDMGMKTVIILRILP